MSAERRGLSSGEVAVGEEDTDHRHRGCAGSQEQEPTRLGVHLGPIRKG